MRPCAWRRAERPGSGLNVLRLVLAGIGAPAIGLIWWWTARRSSQAPGNAALRESTLGSLRTEAEERPPYLAQRERPFVPLEPLSIRADEADVVPVLDEPISPYGDPMPLDGRTARAVAPPPPLPAGASVAPPSAAPAPSAASATAPPGPPSPAAAVASTPAPATPAAPSSAASRSASTSAAGASPGAAPAGERGGPSAEAGSQQQRIVALRVCAVNEARWPGRRLIALLESRGLAFGRYQVFHRKHSDGRSIFCVASLTEPGAFDAQRMSDQDYRGVTLFAVLPGPVEPLLAFDELMATAREIARELSGTLQDDRGMPLSPQRAAALREDIARFAAAGAGSGR